MSRVVALIDGEHYPPVVRFALEQLAREHEVVAAAFLGGTEKIDLERGLDTYGVPLVTGPTPAATLATALAHWAPELVIDLSDEPVLSSAQRFELASVALAHGVAYRGADFGFEPQRSLAEPATPVLAIVGTGKRVGKTALSADIARRLKAGGRDVVVLAMGRGGPAEPELIRGDEVALTTADLLALARQGKHASSDNYEDAVMSRVTTVGCRRCGGGMAGATFFSNVREGAALADSLGKELLIAEGSGAAIPPVAFDAAVLVVGAGRGETYVRDYFGPYRLAQADLVVIAGAEEPVATAEEVASIRAIIAAQRPDLPVIATTFRPRPIESVAGKRVFFATTAPSEVVPSLAAHLAAEHGCHVVGASAHLSDRMRLGADMDACLGGYDVLLTELKAAAIDVVAIAGEEAGVPTVLCDNVPVAVDGSDLGAQIARVAQLAIERGCARNEASQ
ncbi:MAG: 2,3-diphosphoglycerate synthetase [Coriobacteriia bacterium]|nr:2,3-diphosphoglycerate synthetase [Coriobacteriia bacterium]